MVSKVSVGAGNCRRSILGIATQTGLLTVILLGAVKTGERLHEASVGAPTGIQILLMGSTVLGIHTFVLALGVALAAALRISRPDGIAVAIAGSQKTLMIGLPMAGELQTSILPLVIFHAGQLVIDAIFAERQRRQVAAAGENGNSPKSVAP
jgi:sodium/bile acid cotransporter 7